MKEFIVGIVCSGNTCRSPIAAAWLHHLLDGDPLRPAQIWTAGLNVEENDNKKVEQEPLLVALEMGMPPTLIRNLEKHKAEAVTSVSLKTDLLVWITDPEKISYYERGKTRIQFMRDTAKDLGAFLLIVPEADHAWEAKERGESASKVMEAYREQAHSLRRWAWRLRSLIPSTSDTTSTS